MPKVGVGGGDDAKLAAQGVDVGSSRGGGGLHEDGGVVGRLKVCLGEDSLGGAMSQQAVGTKEDKLLAVLGGYVDVVEDHQDR